MASFESDVTFAHYTLRHAPTGAHSCSKMLRKPCARTRSPGGCVTHHELILVPPSPLAVSPPDPSTATIESQHGARTTRAATPPTQQRPAATPPAQWNSSLIGRMCIVTASSAAVLKLLTLHCVTTANKQAMPLVWQGLSARKPRTRTGATWPRY